MRIETRSTADINKKQPGANGVAQGTENVSLEQQFRDILDAVSAVVNDGQEALPDIAVAAQIIQQPKPRPVARKQQEVSKDESCERSAEDDSDQSEQVAKSGDAPQSADQVANEKETKEDSEPKDEIPAAADEGQNSSAVATAASAVITEKVKADTAPSETDAAPTDEQVSDLLTKDTASQEQPTAQQQSGKEVDSYRMETKATDKQSVGQKIESSQAEAVENQPIAGGAAAGANAQLDVVETAANSKASSLKGVMEQIVASKSEQTNAPANQIQQSVTAMMVNSIVESLKSKLETADNALPRKNSTQGPLALGGAGELKGQSGFQEGGRAQVKSLPRAAVIRTMEKVEAALKEAAKSKDVNTISLRLDPVELGNVRVDVSIKDGALKAKLAPESQQVAHLLREKAHDLQYVLRKLGLDVDTVSVAVTSDSFVGFETGDGERSWQGGQGSQGNMPGSSFADGMPLGARSIEEQNVLDHWVA